MCRTFIPSISKTTSPLIPWPLDKSLPTLQILLALRLAPFLCCSPLSCTRKQSNCPWSFLHTFLFECSFIVYLNTACSTTCKKLRNPAQDVPGVDQLLPTRYNNNACLVNTCDQSVLTEHLTPLQILQTLQIQKKGVSITGHLLFPYCSEGQRIITGNSVHVWSRVTYSVYSHQVI